MCGSGYAVPQKRAHVPYFRLDDGVVTEIKIDDLPPMVVKPQQLLLLQMMAPDPWSKFVFSTICSVGSHLQCYTDTAFSWTVVDRFLAIWWWQYERPRLVRERWRFIGWHIFGRFFGKKKPELSMPFAIHLIDMFIKIDPRGPASKATQHLIDEGYLEQMRAEADDRMQSFYRLTPMGAQMLENAMGPVAEA